MLTRKPTPKPSRDDRCAALLSATVRPVSAAVMATPQSLAGNRRQEPSARQRDPMRPTSTTAAERRHMGRVAALGCVVCRLLGLGPTPAQVHHIREGQGSAQRAGNYCVIPLCPDHHTGPAGVHGDRSAMRLLKVDEIDLLDITIGELAA